MASFSERQRFTQWKESCVRDGKLTGCSFKTDSSAGPLKLFLTVLHSRNETYHVVGIVPGAEVVVMVEAR